MKNLRFLSITTILVVVLVAAIGISVASAQTVCSPATAISVPFTKDGGGTFCYQASSMCYAINSWNMTLVQINGNNYTNMWVSGPSIPALNGVFTITYNGGQFGHFEIAGPCSGGATNTPVAATLTRTRTPIGPTATGTGRSQTPAITMTRTFTPTGGVISTATRTSTPTFTPIVNPTITRTVTPAGDLGFGSVSGTVTSAITGAPLAGVLVTCTHGSIFTPVEEHCVGTYTTGANGTYIFNNIHIYATDTITIRVDLAGYESQWFVSQSLFTSANFVKNFAMSLVATPTRTATPGPSLTPTITLTPTLTLTPSATLPGGICAPVEADITAPFTFDGAGTHCWRISALSSLNNNNLKLLSINGLNLTGVFVTSGQLPPKINGFWYITYVSETPFGHLQISQ